MESSESFVLEFFNSLTNQILSAPFLSISILSENGDYLHTLRLKQSKTVESFLVIIFSNSCLKRENNENVLRIDSIFCS